MNRIWAVAGGIVLGVAIMLGALQPWKRAPKRESPAPVAPRPEDRTAALDQAQLALTAMKAGKVQEAQDLLAKAASLDPDLFEVPLFQGHLEMLKGDHA